ncbi:MAG: DMT family transporter [Thermodesulfobacteriota bacterium]
MAAVYAILSAFLYAVANVYTKKGFAHTNILSAFIISIISCFISSLAICLFLFSFERYFDRAVWFFIAAGLVGPFLGRALLYEAIDRVGASVACTVFEAKPIFSVVIAVLVLEERLSISILFGVLLMMLGTVIISRESSGGDIVKKWTRRDLILPLFAGACYGGSHVLRKIGINLTPEPFMAVMWQNAGALICSPFLIWAYRNNQQVTFHNQKAWFVFGVAGILQVAAQWCLFAALEYGTVVVVSPLTSLSTLFVLLLAAFLLKKVERITWKIVTGALLIIGATVVLTLFP